ASCVVTTGTPISVSVPNTTSNVNFALTVKGPLTDVRLTANPASPQPAGTTITLTAAATGGTAPAQDRRCVVRGAGWRVLQEWSAATSVPWTPATPGQYLLEVWARSASNANDVAEKYSDLPYTVVTPSMTGVTLSADLASPQPLGTIITLTAAAMGGTAPA